MQQDLWNAPDRREMRSLGWAVFANTLVVMVLAIVLMSALQAAIAMPNLMPMMMERIAQNPESFDSFTFAESGEVQTAMLTALTEHYVLYSTLSNVIIIVCALVGMAVVLRHARRYGVPIRPILKKPSAPVSTIAFACIGCIGIGMLGGWVTATTELLFNQFGFSIVYDITTDGLPMAAKLVMIAYLVAIGPFVEEVVFRGVLAGGLRRYGEHFAVVCSAVVFALMHGNLTQFAGPLLIGLFLGYMYMKTGSLTLCVIIHAFNNLFSLTLSDWFLPWLESSGMSSVMVSIALTFALPVFGIVTYRNLRRKYGALDRDGLAGPPTPYTKFFATLPMVLFTALCLILIVNNVSMLP